MHYKNTCVSRGSLVGPIAVLALIFVMLSFQLTVFQLPQANAEKAQKDPTSPAVDQEPASDKAQPPKVEYREAKRLEIPKTSGMSGNWHAIAYEPNEEDEQFPEWPAKLCFFSDDGKGKQDCFQAIAARKDHTWNCQFVRELSVVPIFETKYPQEGVLFVPMFMGGGSGTLSMVTLWVFSEQKKQFVNMLPLITITNQAEYKILQDKGPALDGTLVTADFEWEEGESHFEPHKYRITIYRHNEHNKVFEPVGDYVTKKKYPGLDDVDTIDVISHEMETIEKLIAEKR